MLSRNERWLPLGLALAWLGIVVFALASHELARDEAEPWLLALHSGSLPELFRHVKYEGHASLWYMGLFVVSRVTSSPVAMQILHLGMAAAVVWTVARYAPFTPLQKALFAFGYFPLYEYAVVSRDYSLGVLFLFGACAALGARPGRFPVVVVLMALVPHTNAFALILGLALGLALLVDRWLPGGPVLVEDVSRAQFAWGFLVVAISVGLAAIQLAPPPDPGIAVGLSPHLEPRFLAKRVRSVIPALLPIPQIQTQWWAKPFLWNLWDSPPFRFPATAAVCAFLAWVGLGLARRARALVFLVAAIGGTVLFMYLKFAGETRHVGHFFIALVIALWLGRIESARRGGVESGWIGRAWASAHGPVFTAILGVQVLGGLLAVFLEHRYEFSNGKRAAAYLVEHDLDRSPLVAETDYAAQSVLAFLGRKEAYFPRGDRLGSFVIWDLKRGPPVTDSTCLERAQRLAAEGGGSVVLLLSHPLAAPASESPGTRKLAQFVGSTVGDEDFYLYSVAPGP